MFEELPDGEEKDDNKRDGDGKTNPAKKEQNKRKGEVDV